MFEFSPYHIFLVLLGIGLMAAYWLPRFVSGREPAASALVIVAGLLVSLAIPELRPLLDPTVHPTAWEHAAEIVVIISLFATGLRIDRVVASRRWLPTVYLLLIGMPICIALVAFLGTVVAGMTLAGAVLLGAVLAPTDPVLAGDVQVGPPLEGGEHPVRFTLTTEAGLNDGLAFPFVYLALAIAASGTGAEVFGEWLWRDVGYRILVGGLGGAGVGWLLGRILFGWPRRNPLADTESGVIALAGVIAAYGLTELAEGYGFIAAFIAGITLRQAEAGHAFHTRLHGFSDNIEHALTALLLIGLGAALPVLLPALTMAGAAIGLALIFVVRPVFGWLALGKVMPRTRERAVVAFYGVRGVGSIYYLAYAATHVELVDIAELWAIIAFTVLVSTVVHGFTAGVALEKATGQTSAGEKAEG